MPSSDWVPSADADLDAFAVNFEAKITASPTTYGLVAGDATAFNTVADDFATKLALATDPGTKTSVTVASKNTARAVLVANLRSLARRVQAHSTITAAQLTDLGLPVRDTVATPIPVPSSKPILAVMSHGPQLHNVRFADEGSPTSRRKPAGASGLQVFYTAGTPAVAITDPEEAQFEGVFTKADFVVSYDAGDIGKTATIRARWMNRKGEVGPLSDPITATIAA